LVACGTADPPPTTYVLGSPESGEAKVESLIGRPVLEVKPVRLPDYIDVTDILVRRPGNVLTPSQTGRWAERLSAGVTRAFAAGLERRLSGIAVTTSSPPERPSCQTTVDIQTFERSVEGPVLFVAQWWLLRSESNVTLIGERLNLVEPVATESDATIVAAMSRAIDRFAEQAAASISRFVTACGIQTRIKR
jgi:uncharacterized lipoprotein YmbA